MRVSIGIITRNRAAIVTKAIESALAQGFPEKNVIVFDDASTDETSELAARYPSVIWRRSPQVQGYLALRNLLMKESVDDFFFSLDDDAWFLSDDAISAGVSYLVQRDSVAALAYDVLSPDKADIRPRTSPVPTNVFIGCGHMVRLKPVREAGYYIPGPGWYGGEEKDLCIRLMDSGHQIMKLPGVHVWHDKTMVARDQPAQYSSGVANDLALTFRRTPMTVLPLALVGKVFQHFRFAMRKRMMPSCLKGFRLFFGHLGELWRSRRPVKLATVRAYRRLSRTNCVNRNEH
jgi:glycosyltransferase involved in cell wall biosynthesis